MKARSILVSVASAMLLVTPLAVQAAPTKAPAPAAKPCKGLKGNAQKDCQAKVIPAKPK
jgi:Spy/CpxP family protein refolding chaperone